MAEETKPDTSPETGGTVPTEKGAVATDGDTGAKEAEVKEPSTEVKGEVPKVPEKADGYEVKFLDDVKIPEDALKTATETYSTWREFAKQIGLTQDQFKALISADARMRITRSKQSQDDFNSAQDSLKKEWGKDYETKLGQAEKATNGIFSADDVAYFKKSGLANDPRFVKAMYGLSGKLSEDSFVRNERKGGKAERKIDPLTGNPMLDYPSMK